MLGYGELIPKRKLLGTQREHGKGADGQNRGPRRGQVSLNGCQESVSALAHDFYLHL